MSRRDRKLAAQPVAGSPDSPVDDAGDPEGVDLDAAEAREFAEHLADVANAKPEPNAPARSEGLVPCRVHAFGSFNHDMVMHAPGELVSFPRAVIDASNGALIPAE